MNTVIYGNGAIARIVYSYASRSMNICGFTVDDICIKPGCESFLGKPLVPLSKVREHFDPDLCKVIIAVGFIGMNELRERKYAELHQMGYSFTSFIHESVIIHDDVVFGDCCIILDHVSIHPGCNIGCSSFISSNVNVGHDCTVGDFNWINSGVSIAGGCNIGKACFFGVGASVAHSVRIGNSNFIAANTLINRNTEDNQVYLSEPGQLFRLNSKRFLEFSHIFDQDSSSQN